MGPGYILIRYGKTGRYRNNCHKGRSSLETQIPRKEVMRAMKGRPGKHHGQSGAGEGKGKCGQEPSLWFPREGTGEAG